MKPARRRRDVWHSLPAVWVALAVSLARPAGAVVTKTPVPCDFVCQGGGCAYSNCAEGASCPGGACSFDRCQGPSCQGGNCDFVSCHHPVCGGGGCHIIDPKSTLRDGYCDGGACKVDNTPFPSRIEGKLSI